YYAHKLAKRLSDVRKQNAILLPDGKTQVSVEYENDQIKRIHTIVVSTQHVAHATQQEIAEIVMRDVISQVIPDELLDEDTIYLINPSGSFVVGGSFGDSGTTGRKIVVDTYGGMGRIGGGCFSSKDPSKVDRSAAYYCRYVAKNIVAHGLARKCEIQVAYAIGKVKPVSIMVDCFGTGTCGDDEILQIIKDNFSFEVKDIIQELDLCRPIYKQTACYGHFGREEFSWEQMKDIKF
ncbi:MAG: methionine adenosyltransferase, partial [Longicatena sp.]